MKTINSIIFMTAILISNTSSSYAGDGVCAKCQMIREYNTEHPQKCGYYEDYLKEHPEQNAKQQEEQAEPAQQQQPQQK